MCILCNAKFPLIYNLNRLLLHEQDNLSAQIDDISALSSMAEAAKTSRRKSAGFRSVPLSNTKAAESHGHIIAPCNEEEYAALKFIETVRGSNLGQELERSVLNGSKHRIRLCKYVYGRGQKKGKTLALYLLLSMVPLLRYACRKLLILCVSDVRCHL